MASGVIVTAPPPSIEMMSPADVIEICPHGVVTVQPSGPSQEKPVPVEPVSVMVLPSQTGELLEAVGVSGLVLTMTVVVALSLQQPLALLTL